jgi:hypothetical protein
VFLGGLVGRPPATLEKRIPINPDEAILQQFRRYCRLDSAAMVMAYALMRDHVKGWKGD